MAIMKYNNRVTTMLPNELMHWVIELLGADPLWWLLIN